MRQLIVDLKTEYVDFTDGEITTICAIQFSGRRPSHHTVKAVLAMVHSLHAQDDNSHALKRYVDLTFDSYDISRSSEGQFHIINVMRRMSQVHFEQVSSWQGAKLAHERFVTDYNTQPHWAHRKREDNRLSPAEVLGQETGKLRTPLQLHRIFYAMRYLRRLDRLGYAHFRRWKLYGEEGWPAILL